MAKFRILIGGNKNGDIQYLREAVASRVAIEEWTAPKDSEKGDPVVFYIPEIGFFATGEISSSAFPREDWPNRYGVKISDVKLIDTPISIGIIKKQLPELKWANYPRTFTSPSDEIGESLEELIELRRKGETFDFDEESLETANLDELRMLAISAADSEVRSVESTIDRKIGAIAVKRYVLARSNGICEACGELAPFERADGTPYLEPHHTKRLADEGPDHPRYVIALCPNCHRKAHYAHDHKSFNADLIKKLEEQRCRKL